MIWGPPYFRGDREVGLKFRCCKVLEGKGLGKSELKFQNGGGGYQK